MHEYYNKYFSSRGNLYAHKKFHLKKIISPLNFDIAHESKFSQSTAKQIYYVLKHTSV